MRGALAAPLVRAYCAPRAARFAAALDDPEGAQRAVLARIVRACAATGYGRSLGLEPGDDLAAFRHKVPLAGYGEVAPWIERQRGGEPHAITPGTTRAYEPTSGSGGTAKRIPYNDAMLAAFRSVFAVWAHDVLRHLVRPRSGRTFMSISPPLADAEGFADDREYLGPVMRALVGPFLVLPPRAASAAGFRDALALALASAADLEIVSVWNPSYLALLMDHLEAHRDRFLPQLAPSRRAAFERDAVQWEAVWPGLQLVSCWSDAAAAPAARALAKRLPQATLQGKGLLATEAPVTLPLAAAGGCVPLVDETFIELIDDAGVPRALWEAAPETEYEVVITQPGGLLRYRLGDRVAVRGRHRAAPVLAFTGRADAVCDLVGEKLAEPFVAAALARVVRAGAFAMLLPLASASGPARYCLLTDADTPGLAAAVETALAAALRYREARALGQLEAVHAVVRRDMRRAVHDALAAEGMKAGDIKDRALEPSLARAARVHARVAQRSVA